MSLNLSPCLPVVPSQEMRRKVTFWIRAFNPNEQKIDAIVDSYVRLSTTQHCWAIDLEPGVLLARVGGVERAHYYLVEHGVLSVFEESSRLKYEHTNARNQSQPKEALAQWMMELPARVRSGEILLHAGGWMLSSFCSYAKKMAIECGAHELGGAFSEHGERAGGSIRMNKAHLSARSKYHLSRIGSTLKQVRLAMPKDVVARLWSMQLYDGRFARWVEEGKASRTYRLQALKAQPFLLPCALFYTGKLVPAPKEEGQREWRQGGMWMQENPCTEALVADIDAGRTWVSALAKTLSYGTPQHDDIALATRQIQMLAGKTAASTLSVPAWQKRGGRGGSSSPLRLLAMAHSLSGNRRPVNRKGWLMLSKLQHHLGDVGRASQSWDSFLKGMPMSWNDAGWEEHLPAISGLGDSMNWLRHSLANQEVPVRVAPGPLAQAMREMLTLKQLLGWSERMHALFNQVETDRRANREDEARKQAEHYRRYNWPAAWTAPAFKQGALNVVELTDAGQLEDEGAALRHCVGSYAWSCCNGTSRIFSVRNDQGTSLSTFELHLVQVPTKPTRVLMIQHRAAGNQEPSKDAKKIVRGFLAEARKEDSGFELHWPAVRSPSGHSNEMNNIDQLGPLVLETTQRAFPSLLAHMRTLPLPEAREALVY